MRSPQELHPLRHLLGDVIQFFLDLIILCLQTRLAFWYEWLEFMEQGRKVG